MTYCPKLLLQKIDDLFSENPNLYLKDLSKNLHVSRNTIEKLIQHVKGVTFRDYRQEKLLEKAVELLDSWPQLQLKEIAIKLGYTSQPNFSRFMKASAGKTPSQLRLSK
jgi:two-component system, response regulator YesN